MNTIRYIVSTISSSGGVETFCKNVLPQIKKENWDVGFLVLGKYDLKEVEEYRRKGIQVICLSSQPDLQDTFFSLLFQYAELKKILKELPRNIVHIHTCSHSVVIVLHCLRALDYKVRIVHSHTAEKKDISLLHKACFSFIKKYIGYAATGMVACSRSAAEFLFPQKAILSGKVKVIPNGISTDAFAFNAKARTIIRRELRWQENYIVGYVGRLEAEKNIFFLLDSFFLLKELLPGARLLIVGDGSQRAFLEQKVKEKGMAPDVKFTGETDRVADFLCSMDVFAMPSIFEGFGIALLEAQCSGLPCVVSEGVPEEACFFGRVKRIPLADGAKHWADTIWESLMDAPPVQRENAFLRLKGKMDLETMGQQLSDLYQKCMYEETDLNAGG